MWLDNPFLPDYAPGTVKATAWAVWAVIAVAVIAVGLRRARRWPWARLTAYLPGPVQGLAATLLGAAAATTASVGVPAAHAAAPATTADDPLGHGHPTHADPARSHLVTSPRAAVRPHTHTVELGETLWGIADDALGDPHRWRDIYALNRGHEQADGHALTDPDEIDVDWVLTLPARDATPAPSNTATPSTPADRPADDSAAQPSPTASAAATPPPATGNPSTPATTAAAPSSDACLTATPAEQLPSETETAAPGTGERADGQGIRLPSQAWVSLGLAGLITTIASLLRLQRRRRARLTYPIPSRIGPQPAPVPDTLTLVDVAGARHQTTDDEPLRPAAPAVPAPIGVDPTGSEVSLFDLPGPGLALTGDGAEPAARAALAAALATGATQSAETRPVVVTTTEILARLLPAGTALVGLDPDGTSYDGERLIVLSDAAAATTHAEEEMIVRRRLLDTFDLDTVTALNERTDHAEMQPPYVLLIEATTRHAARLRAVGAHRPALHLHPVVLGGLDGLPTVEIAADGTTRDGAAGLARLSTLTANDLAAVLAMLTDAAPPPEPGHDINLDPSDPAAAEHEAPTEQTEPVPAQRREAAAPVRLRVLGPVRLETPAGPVVTGMRSGSYTVLASLAVHPSGRTLDQLAADLHPDTDPGTAGKRIRTDISTTRRVLRAATGDSEAMFVVYDPATGRYRLDAELIAVDLWQMLTAIEAANTADDDTQALALLREVIALYGGDFADGTDQTWITDYATTYRHQILSVFARIAEILEPDHPDQAVAALERALEFDPVNEELYQRVMRIHGRAGRPDAVRRTLRRLEERLADLGDAEPSQATRRVAARQLRPATAAASGGPR
ncbi:BTAD domain-containing putative transcriptional regulator [Actinoplanes sp. NBRC 103695]|uniref:BTAD domain-containing putative transcriptional regulator n=1 Tax=Actinoplanes sp. NBRC 103695 TaxID=3032202 RepID=UPI0024A2249B|nr:BTAD domain-containing putative transcriptional regulator [Actinoplanes sp. NBRC 103695]GLY96536.1 hypothetical protein Acsp02_37910 [Actinoplanes sp. NBRC 103695]